MEFLRMGSSIPGSYWGCCAFDIIQNFSVSPSDRIAMELVSGDGGQPLIHPEGGPAFIGFTYEEVFWQRVRIGTFNKIDMPNHGFLAAMSESQIHSVNGAAWLKLLKRAGFEFIRTVDNSVYSGLTLAKDDTSPYPPTSHPVHLFALFRNIGRGRIKDPYTPPKCWQEIEGGSTEVWPFILDKETLATLVSEQQYIQFKELPDQTFYTLKQVTDEGVPICMAGRRSKNPQRFVNIYGDLAEAPSMGDDAFEEDEEEYEDEEYEEYSDDSDPW